MRFLEKVAGFSRREKSLLAEVSRVEGGPDESCGHVAGLKLISKIPQGEVCNYLGIMDTLGGPGIFGPTD